VFVLAFVSLPVFAQDPNKPQPRDPKFELFTGYSYRTTRLSREPAYYHAIYPPYLFPFQFRRENAHGWGLAVTYKFHRHIGVTADLAGQYGRVLGPIIPAIQPPGSPILSPERHNFASYQFLLGPTFSLRSGRVTEFAHALVGGFHSAGGVPRTDFAMGYGGGVDVRLTDLISVRAFQADWIPVKHGSWENHFRFQTGIIFNFGRR
jgi:hypothetical protein